VRIRVLTSALEDLRRGKRFYDRQQAEIGDYFYDSLFEDIDRLEFEAGIHRKVFGFHRLLAKRFPHAIYYKLTEEDEATVFRILDCRQDPETIRDKLEE
jgi:hypothetical protein